ncbi:hypothetical protein [Roseateles sp.]|uniref:hypothetical protein n=1 Tax=Roseateles sp. TaxID=1971397 RepID=UPI0039EB6160
MLRSILVTLATGAALLGATAAHAGTHWSIGINLPAAGVYVSDAPRYVVPAPVYYDPPPVVYVPAPRYVQREVYYAPPPPRRVVYETVYRERRWGDRERRWDRYEHGRHDHDRDDYGPRRGR